MQSGGNFDVDYEVTGPTGKIVLDGEAERQGDFVFTVNEIGDYKFCFRNTQASHSDKVVDFEIAVSENPHPDCRPDCGCNYVLLTFA